MNDSLILTGISYVDGQAMATVRDLNTHQSHLVYQDRQNARGWQLTETKGDTADLKTMTAKIRLNGSDTVSVRYQKPPPRPARRMPVRVSTQVGDGSAGGGTNPHKGPDPRVLTPDQLSDARRAARSFRDGFEADGYPPNQPVPPEVLNKVARLSYQQREAINIEMFQHRNKGLGMEARQKIYNGLIDRQLQSR